MAYIHQVKYYECDRMGITHHSNYVRIMEEARIDFLEDGRPVRIAERFPAIASVSPTE